MEAEVVVVEHYVAANGFLGIRANGNSIFWFCFVARVRIRGSGGEWEGGKEDDDFLS